MKDWLKLDWNGLPRWMWAAMVAAAIINEVITRAKWTRAQSIFQAPFVAVLKMPVLGTVLGAVPVVGAFLRWLAGPEPLPVAGDPLPLPPPPKAGEQ